MESYSNKGPESGATKYIHMSSPNMWFYKLDDVETTHASTSQSYKISCYDYLAGYLTIRKLVSTVVNIQ